MTGLNKKSIEDIEVGGKRVLVRCDFNVPISGGVISDDKRIVESLPTIKYLLSKGAKVVLCSHLGRPKGEFNMKYSLAPVATRLSELLGIPVAMAKDVIGEDAQAKAAALKDGEVLLIENVRFHAEEEKNDKTFAKALASLAEIYVNDAFGTAHRAHASTAGVAEFLPAVCGYLIQKEISIMGGALENPKRPFTAILGGAKVSDKIGVIKSLLDKVDILVIGGGMAYTFVKALGGNVGDSICEHDKFDLAKELVYKAITKGVRIMLPIDTVVADQFAADAKASLTPTYSIPEGLQGMDIGPNTIEIFSNAIKSSATVIWNGPMGVFEFENFAHIIFLAKEFGHGRAHHAISIRL